MAPILLIFLGVIDHTILRGCLWALYIATAGLRRRCELTAARTRTTVMSSRAWQALALTLGTLTMHSPCPTDAIHDRLTDRN